MFPHDAVSVGSADVLKSLERLEEAEAVYREVLELFGDDRRQAVVSFTGLAGVLREMGRFGDALEQVDAALGWEPNDSFALSGSASLPRRAGNLFSTKRRPSGRCRLLPHWCLARFPP